MLLAGTLTTGQIYYYGGIGLAILAGIGMITSIVVFEHKKKKFLSNMDKETE